MKDTKTSEEIKKGLECCANGELCYGYCPYGDNIFNKVGCSSELSSDALALIEQLERERDAAVEDIKKAALFLCQTCKKYHPVNKHYCDVIPAEHFGDGAISCGQYEWRGVKEEKDENTRED